MKYCPLCVRRAKMSTLDGMNFWLEYGQDGKPRLFTDTRQKGGGMNALCVSFCPICGNELQKQEADNGEEM